MSAQEIIEQIKSLPASERAQVAKFVVENDDSWIPESFKEGMADAAAGRFVDMETVLSGVKPPSPPLVPLPRLTAQETSFMTHRNATTFIGPAVFEMMPVMLL